MRYRLFAGILLALSLPAAAFEGRVVRILDGDTLVVLDGQQQVHVRLAEVDAPEKRQPYGTRARASLALSCFERTADITGGKPDR